VSGVVAPLYRCEMEIATPRLVAGRPTGGSRPPPEPLVERARPGVSPSDRRGAAGPMWTRLWDRLTVRSLLLRGLPILGLLMFLTAANVDGRVVTWELAHTTFAGFLALALALSGAHQTSGPERRLRLLVALGVASWTVGQLCWVVQTSLGIGGLPTASDVGYLGIVVPVVGALILAVHGRLRRAEELAVYLDSVAIFLAITAAIIAMYGDNLVGVGTVAAVVTVASPILHLATAGAGLVALLAIRSGYTASSGYLLLAGFAVVGLAWVEWLGEAVVATPVAGTLINYAFPLGIVFVGLGGATWRLGAIGAASSPRVIATLLGRCLSSRCSEARL
jgi:hypothetical protein